MTECDPFEFPFEQNILLACMSLCALPGVIVLVAAIIR